MFTVGSVLLLIGSYCECVLSLYTSTVLYFDLHTHGYNGHLKQPNPVSHKCFHRTQALFTEDFYINIDFESIMKVGFEMDDL